MGKGQQGTQEGVKRQRGGWDKARGEGRLREGEEGRAGDKKGEG